MRAKALAKEAKFLTKIDPGREKSMNNHKYFNHFADQISLDDKTSQNSDPQNSLNPDKTQIFHTCD